MSNYELVVVMDATRPEEEIRAALARVREILESFKCEVTYVEEWGRRKMAFPIKKKIEGFYTVFYFRAGDENHPGEELDRFAKISDVMIRHMIVRVPKLKTEEDARREQAQREAEQALREEQRAKAMAAEAARAEQAASTAAPDAAEKPLNESPAEAVEPAGDVADNETESVPE